MSLRLDALDDVLDCKIVYYLMVFSGLPLKMSPSPAGSGTSQSAIR